MPNNQHNNDKMTASATYDDLVWNNVAKAKIADRVGGGLHPPSSHTTVRTDPFTAVQVIGLS